MNIVIDNLNISYNISGNESATETFVILQGWGTKYEYYEKIAALLRNKFKVVQFDFPGFGGSDEPPVPWGVDDYTDFFDKLMEKLSIKEAILLGHSYGGRVIIKYANREKRNLSIKKIILMDAAGIMPKKTFKQKFNIRKYKIMKAVFKPKIMYFLFPEIIDDWRDRQGSADYKNASEIMRACLVKAVNEDLTALLPGIKEETLIIWGEDDDSTPVSDAYLMDKMIPDSGLAIIKNAGHFSYIDQPQIFTEILSNYLKL